jgi:hypothetical protein
MRGESDVMAKKQEQIDNYLSEQSLASAAGRRGVVDVNVVVFGGDGFLHKRFIEYDPVDFDVVLGFY